MKSQRKELNVTVGHHNGGMSFFIDGAVQPFSSFKINESSNLEEMLESAEIEIPAMAQQGIRHCWVPLFIDWQGPGQYDFTDMDTRIKTVLDLYDNNTPSGSPEAVVVVRIQAAVFSPSWYINQKLDSEGKPVNLIEFRNKWGSVDSCSADDVDRQRFRTEFANCHSTFAISPGDSFWDTHAVDCLKAIVNHVRKSDYAHRVYGWLPCAFNTNEWFLRTFAHEATCDFSEPTQKAFREYLQSTGAAAESQPVPSSQACHQAGRGEFLDPDDPDAEKVEKFSLWLNNRMADIILKFARTLREIYADNPKLIGFFYGYSLGLSRLFNLSQCGQLALDRLLQCDDIDFFSSPCEYFFRADEKPFTASMVMGPLANSGASCNKLAFLEDDHRPPGGNTAFFGTRDEWHDEMYFRHNFAQMWSHGQQLWWYSLGAQWFKFPYRQKIVGNLHRLGIEALDCDRSSVAEVAVIVDERSISTTRFNPPFQKKLFTESHGEFFPAGAPFETFELQSFLQETDISKFKFIAFLNLFRIDSTLLDMIKKLKNGNRTIMFSFAPGVLDDRNSKRVFSIDSASELTGMNLALDEDSPLTVWLDPERSDLMPNHEDIRFGWLEMDIGFAGPVIGIKDPESEIYGYLRSGLPGFGAKKHEKYQSVFSSATGVPGKVLRELMRNAGVHIYSESGDVVYANRSMIAIVANTTGEHEFCLPGQEKLEDVFSGEKMTANNQKFSIFMKRHETRIFWRR